MKRTPDNRLPLIISILLVMGFLWLCFAFPKLVTTAFETLGTILLVLVITAPIVGPLLAGLVGVFSSRPLPPRATPPPPSPTRQPDTLTPLLLGVALGWWLGSGPGDDHDQG